MKRLLFLFAAVALLAVGCASAPPVTHHYDPPLPNEFSQAYEPRPVIVLAGAEESSGKKDEFGEAFVLDDIEIDTEDAEVETEIADPLYYWNIAAYHFNDKFYFWLLKPVAQGYKFVIPEVARTSIDNFFTNLVFPIRFVNNLLQGKGYGAEREITRFAINTMFGLGGLFDVAKKYNGIEPSKEDFGQTLGKWGVGNGFYLVLPLIGPSTLRDGIGLAGDYFLDPTSYVTPLFPDSLGIRAFDTVNGASLTLGDYEALKKGALDPYIALRNAYVDSRKKQVQE